MHLVKLNNKIINMDQVTYVTGGDGGNMSVRFVGGNPNAADLTLPDTESAMLWSYLSGQSHDTSQDAVE